MTINKKLLSDAIALTNAPGISGREAQIAALVKTLTKSIKGLKYEFDGLGSLALIKEGTNKKGPVISISAHMDEVGFMVTKIEKNGFLRITPIGGWWGHVLLGQLLTIFTKDGNTITGVVGSTPPHILSPQARTKVMEVKDMFVDIGVKSDKEIEKLGIRVGAQVVPKSETTQMANPDFIVGKAMDDRVSIASGIEVLRKLSKVNHEATVILICTTQEEVGLRGARTSSFKWTADVAFALDVTIANDAPGMEDRSTKLGTGVALSLFDRSVIANPKLFDLVEQTAIKNKVKYTFDSLTGGGTDAGAIHLTKDGVITMTVSIPTRYMHSHNTIASLSDMQAAADLLFHFCKDFNSKKLTTLKFN